MSLSKQFGSFSFFETKPCGTFPILEENAYFINPCFGFTFLTTNKEDMFFLQLFTPSYIKQFCSLNANWTFG